MSTINAKVRKMAKKANPDDPRAFLYLRELKKRLIDYAKTDPRFDNISECGRHLLRLGWSADKKAREKALKDIT